MIVPNALLGLIESTLNHHIADSRDAQNLLQKIDGEHIAIHITGVGLNVHIFAHSNGLRLHNTHTEQTKPSATLSGSPVDLMASLTTHGFADGIRLEGNTHAIHGLQKTLLACDLDLEAMIAEHIGDMPARFLGQQAGVFTRWLSRYRTTIDMAVKDYLQEEVQHTPTRIEIENFMNDIDDIRMQVDRLEAKTNQLNAKVTPQTKTKAQE